MTIKFLNRGFFQRIFGLPATPKPIDPHCWSFSDGRIMIDLKRATELKKPGSALRLEGDGLLMRVLVIRGDDGKFHAFHNRCTHIGHRRLDPVPGTGAVQCYMIKREPASIVEIDKAAGEIRVRRWYPVGNRRKTYPLSSLLGR